MTVDSRQTTEKTRQEKDCFVCRKHRGEVHVSGGVIYQDDLLFSSHMEIPEGKEKVYLGAVFLEPKRHAPGFEDLKKIEAEAVGRLTSQLARALKAAAKADHIYVFRFGHHIDHLHILIAARYPGTPREYWGNKIDEWPEAPFGGPEEIAKLCDQIRLELAKV